MTDEEVEEDEEVSDEEDDGLELNGGTDKVNNQCTPTGSLEDDMPRAGKSAAGRSGDSKEVALDGLFFKKDFEQTFDDFLHRQEGANHQKPSFLQYNLMTFTCWLHSGSHQKVSMNR